MESGLNQAQLTRSAPIDQVGNAYGGEAGKTAETAPGVASADARSFEKETASAPIVKAEAPMLNLLKDVDNGIKADKATATAVPIDVPAVPLNAQVSAPTDAPVAETPPASAAPAQQAPGADAVARIQQSADPVAQGVQEVKATIKDTSAKTEAVGNETLARAQAAGSPAEAEQIVAQGAAAQAQLREQQAPVLKSISDATVGAATQGKTGAQAEQVTQAVKSELRAAVDTGAAEFVQERTGMPIEQARAQLAQGHQQMQEARTAPPAAADALARIDKAADPIAQGREEIKNAVKDTAAKLEAIGQRTLERAMAAGNPGQVDQIVAEGAAEQAQVKQANSRTTQAIGAATYKAAAEGQGADALPQIKQAVNNEIRSAADAGANEYVQQRTGKSPEQVESQLAQPRSQQLQEALAPALDVMKRLEDATKRIEAAAKQFNPASATPAPASSAAPQPTAASSYDKAGAPGKAAEQPSVAESAIKAGPQESASSPAPSGNARGAETPKTAAPEVDQPKATSSTSSKADDASETPKSSAPASSAPDKKAAEGLFDKLHDKLSKDGLSGKERGVLDMLADKLGIDNKDKNKSLDQLLIDMIMKLLSDGKFDDSDSELVGKFVKDAMGGKTGLGDNQLLDLMSKIVQGMDSVGSKDMNLLGQLIDLLGQGGTGAGSSPGTAAPSSPLSSPLSPSAPAAAPRPAYTPISAASIYSTFVPGAGGGAVPNLGSGMQPGLGGVQMASEEQYKSNGSSGA